MITERKDLEWIYNRGKDIQAHKGILINDTNQENFFVSISSFVTSLNSGEVNPKFPERYYKQNERMIKVMRLDKDLEVVFFKEDNKKGITTLAFPSQSLVEYLADIGFHFSTGRNWNLAFKMFNVQVNKINDFMIGILKQKDNKWFVDIISDKKGNILNEYKEKLRSINCPVT